MTSDEILAIIFGSLVIAACIVVSIWFLIEGYKEAKEKKAEADLEKQKLLTRVDKLEYYLNVLWWEHENKNSDK